MKTNRKTKKLRAARPDMPSQLGLHCAAVFDFTAAAAGEPAKRPSFSMELYNGGPLELGWGRPVYVDLAGLRFQDDTPIYLNHDSGQLVGQANSVIVKDGKLRVQGVITDDEGPGKYVMGHAKNGFKWKSSMGVSINARRFLAENDTAMVNGRAVKGPALVISSGRLGEGSFVPAGADETATATVAASAAKDKTMNFEQWVKAAGWDFATLSDGQKKILQAQFDAEQKAGDDDSKDDVKAGEGGEVTPPTDPDPVQKMRLNAAAESTRIDEIRTTCNGKHPKIEAQAIKDGWSKEKVELEVLRAERPKVNAIQGGSGGGSVPSAEILECAIRLGSTESSSVVEKGYRPEILDAAYKRRRMSWKGLIQATCMLEGVQCPMKDDNIGDWVKAGFSTTSLPGILGAVANKSMMEAYKRSPSVARVIAKKLTANDFKTHTGYRLTGDSTMLEVGQDGELKHFKLGEASYTYSVKTFGRMIGLTRQQWENDDLGAFTEIPLIIGRGATLAIESAFFTLLLANTGTYFGTGNKNYISGADTNLGIAGLDSATQTLLEQIDQDSQPINTTGKYLVVPPSLAGEAKRISISDMLLATGVGSSAKLAASANTYKGLFEPLVSPYLKALTKEWYLFADPADIAAFGIAFLKGVDAPIIEEVQTAPNVLGMAWRGYIDFGVCQVDPRGAVKSKGEA